MMSNRFLPYASLHHRACYFDLNKARPGCCPDRPEIEFHDGIYTFWALDYPENTMGSLVCRTRPGQTAEERLTLLAGEIHRENSSEESRALKKTKYGPLWQLRELVKIGSINHRYAGMVQAIINNRVPRPATVCEMIHWINGHEEDANGIVENLNHRWRDLLDGQSS